jgi:hypothetical protein
MKNPNRLLISMRLVKGIPDIVEKKASLSGEHKFDPDVELKETMATLF